MQIPQKLVNEKFYVHEKILPIRNYHRKFIINLYPEKRKENIKTKQPWFKWRLNNRGNSMTLLSSVYKNDWLTITFGI